MTAYSFGDTDLARERLGLVADTFAPPTRRLLDELPPGARRYVLDLGCGPGYTTALLAEVFPDAFVTGLDASPAMVEAAQARVPDARFVVADITAPLKLPAHLVYARLLLGHLPDPDGALANWAAALLPGAVLVCEEPVRYRSDDPLFAAYEAVVTARRRRNRCHVVGRSGARPRSAGLPARARQCRRTRGSVGACGGDVLAQRRLVGPRDNRARASTRRRPAHDGTRGNGGRPHVGDPPNRVGQAVATQ